MIIAGFDEVGRGAIAGPVVAAAVILRHDTPAETLASIQDSKTLPPSTRRSLATILMHNMPYAVGAASTATIDASNILQATLLAMQRAWQHLPLKPDKALIDGIHTPPIPCQTIPIIKGDQKEKAIAAASIIAKVTRDAIMHRLHQRYPHYGWQNNVGYPTQEHRRALQMYHLSPHHRRTFASCQRHEG